MILDVQEEEAKVLEDGSCEAHDEKGRHDHHPAVAPVRRSGSPGLHLHQVTLQASLLPVLNGYHAIKVINHKR